MQHLFVAPLKRILLIRMALGGNMANETAAIREWVKSSDMIIQGHFHEESQIEEQVDGNASGSSRVLNKVFVVTSIIFENRNRVGSTKAAFKKSFQIQMLPKLRKANKLQRAAPVPAPGKPVLLFLTCGKEMSLVDEGSWESVGRVNEVKALLNHWRDE